MLSLWMAAPGEDFRVEQVRRNIPLVTATGEEMDLKQLEGHSLSVTAKFDDRISVVFQGLRLVADCTIARDIRGRLLGPTQPTPEIRSDPSCPHCCTSCSGCKH